MSTASQTLDADQPAPEDLARANVYALIGRLFYDAPDSSLLAQIGLDRETEAQAGDASVFEQAWRALQDACRSAHPVAVKQEYDTLFVGVGKAEVTPYTSGYITQSAPDRHLVQLRDHLNAWGLARNAAAFEVEDHISGLCDVMRFLIEQGASLGDQRVFFERFIYPGTLPLCEAVMTAASAGLYKQIALFTKAFLELEKAALDMD
jgi:TorA maturation chaperone TorD